MTIKCRSPKKRATFFLAWSNAWIEFATDSSVSAFNRLEAIEILLRLAIGPRSRSADSTDVAASRNARIALSDAAPFLHQVMESNNRARIRLHAASLARFVGELSGGAGPE